MPQTPAFPTVPSVTVPSVPGQSTTPSVGSEPTEPGKGTVTGGIPPVADGVMNATGYPEEQFFSENGTLLINDHKKSMLIIAISFSTQIQII